MFITYGEYWLSDSIFNPGFKFCPIQGNLELNMYCIPQESEHVKILEYIQELPKQDSPLAFGLHPNADLTFRLQESQSMINTLVDTQPKEASSGSGISPEAEIQQRIRTEMLKDIPDNWNFLELMSNIEKMKNKALGAQGLDVPLNVFLKQELERFQVIITIVRTMLVNICDAIDGTIIMTPEIVDAIEAMFQYRVPKKWVYDPTGAEISWLVPSLGGWLKSLKDRYYQLNNWYSSGQRPPSFWLTGFFNPQGFLTAVKQEVTRAQKGVQWSLDDVIYKTDVKSEIIDNTEGRVDKPIQAPSEGVFIHGLFLEGAGWDNPKSGGGKLRESEPKRPQIPFPIIHVSAQNPTVDAAGPMGIKKPDDKSGDKGMYNCPVYKYPRRNDKYLVFRVMLRAEGQAGGQSNNLAPKGMKAEVNWKLKGVTLLCSRE